MKQDFSQRWRLPLISLDAALSFGQRTSTKGDQGLTMDTLTPAERSERMSRVKGHDTGPERVVRRVVSSLGYRYRLGQKGIPGKPDMVFKGRRKVIFVHGCYWHRHPGCALARLPKTHKEFWVPKLEGNRERDEKNLALLQSDGWDVLVIWECELRDHALLAKRIDQFLKKASA